MSISVSSISKYVDDEAFELGKQLILNQDDMKYFGQKLYNVIGSAPLHRVATSLSVTNSYCPEGDSGTTTFTANSLVPCPMNFVTRDCARIQQEYWMGKYNAAEMIGEDFGDLRNAIVEQRIETIDLTLGKERWQGAKSSPAYASTTFVECDGLFQNAYALSATTAANVAKTAFTEANSVVVLKTILAAAMPQAVKQSGKSLIFVQPSDYDVILQSYLNTFGTSTQISLGNAMDTGEFRIPMTQVTLVRMNYMDGMASGSALWTHPDNMAYGSLLNSTATNVNLVYDPVTDKLVFRANFYQGTQFVNAEEVVIVK